MLNKITQKKNLFLIALILPLYMYFRLGNEFLPIEELAISSAVGIDIKESDKVKAQYHTSLLLDNHTAAGEPVTQISEGIGDNYPETRETRQRKLDRKLLAGMEKIVLLSETFAKFGIDPFVDIVLKNPLVNDSVYMAVCKEKPEEIFKVKIPGYPNIADYIKGMIDHSNEFNFTPENYKLIDIYIRLASEGRNVILPYLEIIDGNLQLTGAALFKNSKMVLKVDSEETKIMNLLRENDVRGIITLQENSKKYLSYYGKSKRSVKCIRDNGEYTFTINLSLSGEVISNTLYSDPFHKIESKKAVEKRLSEQVEKQCYDFIEKMQNDYQFDCFELGRIAAAKYGRKTGVDWDEIVTKSKIIVNAKVTINSHGRGEY